MKGQAWSAMRLMSCFIIIVLLPEGDLFFYLPGCLLYLLRYQDEIDNYRSKFESEERGRGRERGRDRREKYRESETEQLSGRQSATSQHSPV